ncbi:MAG: GTPase ObgE [Micavibrio sp.]|nr:GTPase ObgE [Micavibrio sp.]
MKFLDEAKIYLESGKGGAGAVAFRREKFIDMGGPDGGNGGRGGHVYFEVVQNLNTLIDFRYTQHFRASTGDHGRGSNCSGRDGKDIVIKIPVGTVILDEDKETVLFDFVTPGERVLFLKGGDGGFGNAHFKSATNRAPRKALPGWPSEERAVWLRLKLIADSGIIGMPNAGKSTFLSVVSRARPKIADYPFTTLAPNLGVVRSHDNEFVLADIPGLIEGASDGVGLGTRFLGHVERTRVLMHLIDGTQDDIVAAYKTIRAELKAYGGGLAKKPEVIVINKADALGPELAEDQRQTLSKAIRKKVHLISAVSHQGTDDILAELWKHIQKGRAKEADAAAHTIELQDTVFDDE